METATQLQQMVASGERSAVEITKQHLDRIAQRDQEINAFLTTLDDRALARAEQIDQKRASGAPLGKLAGVPIAIKDNIHIKGELTTCSSRFLSNFTAPFDATVTKLLEAEDAILIGKTNLDEFAMGSTTGHSAMGPSRNPWDIARVPGGSSGGSAAAVAARMTPLALGSDTGGSIRQPASLCGIVGFKPTYGRVSRYGLVAFASSLDQIGPFATSVEDVALIMEVLGQHCRYDSTSIETTPGEFRAALTPDLSQTSVGVPWNFLEEIKGDSRALFERSLEEMKAQGAKVVEVDLSLLKYAVSVYYILATAEASTNLARFDGVRYGLRSERAKSLDEVYDLSKEEGFGAEVKRRILLGTYVLSAGYQDAYYRHAQKVRQKIIDQFHAAFQLCTTIALPVSAGHAFRFDAEKTPLEEYMEDLYTIGANLAGLPAISLPMGLTSKGLPVGLQLVGPQLGDVALCQTAYAFEQATQHHANLPEMVRG